MNKVIIVNVHTTSHNGGYIGSLIIMSVRIIEEIREEVFRAFLLRVDLDGFGSQTINCILHVCNDMA